jgi:hypothetical protein
VRVTLGGGARLDSIAFNATTALNAKTQPKLNLGANAVFVGAGEQTGLDRFVARASRRQG